MATVTLRDAQQTLTDDGEISAFLQPFGIWYRRFEGVDRLPESPTDPEILAAYDAPIRELMAEGGYVTADVINIKPEVPGLEAMLNKFNKEHWHDDDEVRFIVEGSGLFHVHPQHGPVFAIEVDAGDLIRVPKGTLHWFDLCGTRRIRAIRLFVDPSGWAPRYTSSGVDGGFQPVCFGPAYFPPRIGGSI